MPVLPTRLTWVVVLALGGCVTSGKDEGTTQEVRYSDEKSEFTLEIEHAGERFSPESHDCGTYFTNDVTRARGDPHSIASCVRKMARIGRPFRIFVCTSGVDYGYCRSTVIPADGRMIVFYFKWGTDWSELDAVECGSYILHPRTREMRRGTLSELEFLEGQACGHRDELYELMVKRLPIDNAAGR